MTHDDLLSQREYIPDGVSASVTVSLSSDDRQDGGEAVLSAVTEELKSDRFDHAIVGPGGCLGFFSQEVVIKVARSGMPSVLYGRVTPEAVPEILSRHVIEGRPAAQYALCQIPVDGRRLDDMPTMDELPFFSQQQQVISWRFGHIDPERITDAFRTGVYKTQDAVLRQSPAETMAMIGAAQTHGHGGQGDPVAARWMDAAARPGDKYLVCNALEVEARSAKDRRIMESDPHALIEGMSIAAHAVGAQLGYVVVNPSYARASARLETAVAQARRHRRLGRGIRGSDFDFDIIVRTGPSGYIMGEETALVSFLSGEAGPRVTPPAMTVSGLYGRPTVVANVETFTRLAALPFGTGEEGPPPTRLFTLDGTVNTGVVEVEVGATLRELVCGIGATPEDRINAIAIGGRLGGILSPDLLDTPLTRQSYRWLGLWPGSGLITVLDSSTPVLTWLRDHLQFVAHESCGYCAPCREGMEQARRIMERLCDGQGNPNDLALLEQLATYVKSSSMCGYGQATPGGLTTALRYFGKEIRERMTTRR